MKNGRIKIAKIIVLFLIIMLFFTIISNKVDYMMTAEVATTQARKGDLSISIDTDALIVDGLVSFNLNMGKESLIQVGDSVKVEFVNGEYKKEANVIEKGFNPDYQSMEFICEFTEETDDVYEGQVCQIRFNYPLGTFDMVVARECIAYEGQSSFVYYIENVKTVLGEEYIVQKVEVNLLEEDEFYAAISGSITDRHIIVQYASKPIEVGSKVRVEK